MSTELSISGNPSALLEIAVKNKADMAQFEKLLELQEKWERRQAEKAFFDAMSLFQANKPKVFKTKKGHNYLFAPLPRIQEAIDPILTNFGLSYSWRHEPLEGGDIRVYCIVRHSQGHTESNYLDGPKDTSGSKNSIQSIGSTNSYLQRYTLCNAFGISADDDDDGNKAEKEETKKQPSVSQWKKIMEKFKSGEIMVDEIEKHFSLSKDQKSELNKLTGNG